MLAETWSNTLGPGGVAAILGLFAILVGGRYVWKGGTGAALDTLVKANEVLQKANESLTTRVAALEQQAVRDQATIHELQARTNVVEVVKPIVDALVRHEQKAEERHVAIVGALEAVAAKVAA